MSAAPAATRPASRPERLHDAARELRVIEGERPSRSIVLRSLAACLLVIAAILASMVLNTRMAQTSFAIRDQQILLNELDAEAWTMQARLEELASPSSLQRAAEANGMVPAGPTGFITLSSATVEGGTPAR
ncbi:hypothetical protein M3T53_05035 [Actinomyces sp. B33]|uniref:hypothetical protein n=1 Tax=Actinomyces sp. B33 TaxID=2942131 RepID=UPI0023424B1C|nr:hypothetical protein [Actinomyces sp. B33]MDC4233076.1 hypothetical protein [Actinomyces sp. B33]